MEVVLLVVELIVAIALIITVLLQRSEGGALGIGGGGGGGMSGFMTGRATANLLTRATAVLAALFMATSLALAVMSSNRSKAPPSVVGESGKPPASAPKTPDKPAKPAGPSAPVR